jgi:hypothetical protein
MEVAVKLLMVWPKGLLLLEGSLLCLGESLVLTDIFQIEIDWLKRAVIARDFSANFLKYPRCLMQAWLCHCQTVAFLH